MPPPSLPRSLTDLLIAFGPCFTAPTMRTFQALVAGFLAQPGQRTVTGMLTGARLAGRRHHDLAYRFFATARWSADQLGLVLLDLICAIMVPPGAPIVLAVDDTLWRRSGRKLHGAAWHHDGAGPGRHRPSWGHRWVVVGVIVHPPFLTRAVCLPILARLWLPGQADRTPLQLARELLDLAVNHVGDRPVHLVGDAAYIGKPLRGLPAQVTVTARLRADAAPYQPPPPRSGRPGRPRVKGDRLPQLIVIVGQLRLSARTVQTRPELVKRLIVHQRRRPSDRAAWASMAAAGARHSGGMRQVAIQAPTLVLHGSADTVVDPRNSELLAESIPNSQLQIFPDLGHLFFWEDPGDSSKRLRHSWSRRKGSVTYDGPAIVVGSGCCGGDPLSAATTR